MSYGRYVFQDIHCRVAGVEMHVNVPLCFERYDHLLIGPENDFESLDFFVSAWRDIDFERLMEAGFRCSPGDRRRCLFVFTPQSDYFIQAGLGKALSSGWDGQSFSTLPDLEVRHRLLDLLAHFAQAAGIHKFYRYGGQRICYRQLLVAH